MTTTNQQLGTTTEKQRRTVGFRSSSDIENFYRFVADNGLRREAKLVLEKISSLLTKNNKKKRKRRGRAKKTLH